MATDIRLPIGMLFTLLGIILAVYGALGDKARYSQSLGIDVNLCWGLVLLVLFFFASSAISAVVV